MSDDEMPDDLRSTHVGAFLFYVIAVALVGVGFFTMFVYREAASYESGIGQIVGGDAYNYIIIAVRGTGFIAAGGVFAVLGLAATIAHEHKRTRWALEHARTTAVS